MGIFFIMGLDHRQFGDALCKGALLWMEVPKNCYINKRKRNGHKIACVNCLPILPHLSLGAIYDLSAFSLLKNLQQNKDFSDLSHVHKNSKDIK
jgi:hypothetical protein